MNRTQMLKLRNVEISVEEAVRRYREHTTALVRLNTQSQHGATQAAVNRHDGAHREIELALLLADQHILIGHLTEERKLVERLYAARRHNIERPELRQRRARVRRIVDGLAAEADLERR